MVKNKQLPLQRLEKEGQQQQPAPADPVDAGRVSMSTPS